MSGNRDTVPVRLGIVGCGSVSQSYDLAIRSLRLDDEAAVTMACDAVPGQPLLDGSTRLDRIRRMWPHAGFTKDHRELVADDDVDVVVVLTSPEAHAEVTTAALEAGKHVLVEKPMAGTLEEAARIVALARERSRHLVCAPHTILSPTFQAIWRRLRDGEIGKVCLARARYGEANLSWSRWRYADLPGSGPLQEMGVYNLATLTGLLGPVRRVSAMASIAEPERRVGEELMRVERSDTMHVLLDFGGGTLASIATGYSMHGTRSPAIELYGSDGTIEMGGEDWAPDGYALLHGGAVHEPGGGTWALHGETAPEWHWTDGLRHLVACVRSGEPPLETPEHAYHVQEVMVRAEEAAASGETLPVESTFPELRLERAPALALSARAAACDD